MRTRKTIIVRSRLRVRRDGLQWEGQDCKCCCSLIGAAHIYSSGKDEVQGFHRGPTAKGVITSEAEGRASFR